MVFWNRETIGDISGSNYVIAFNSVIVCLTFTVLWYWWSYSMQSTKLTKKTETRIEKKAGSRARLRPLLPPPPKHNIQQRKEVVKSIRSKFSSIRDRCPVHDSVLTVYLEGPPAFGKTQAARLFADEYYHTNVRKYIAAQNVMCRRRPLPLHKTPVAQYYLCFYLNVIRLVTYLELKSQLIS